MFSKGVIVQQKEYLKMDSFSFSLLSFFKGVNSSNKSIGYKPINGGIYGINVQIYGYKRWNLWL